MVTTAVSIQTVTGATNYKSIRVYKWRHAFLFCYPFSHISLLMHLCTHTHTHAPHRHIYTYVYIYICTYDIYIGIYPETVLVTYMEVTLCWDEADTSSSSKVRLAEGRWNVVRLVGYLRLEPERLFDSGPWAILHQKQICHIKSKAWNLSFGCFCLKWIERYDMIIHKYHNH